MLRLTYGSELSRMGFSTRLLLRSRVLKSSGIGGLSTNPRPSFSNKVITFFIAPGGLFTSLISIIKNKIGNKFYVNLGGMK